ncbi:hypothetical protein CAPTEDRAFT_109747, partial [Capitella teleta]
IQKCYRVSRKPRGIAVIINNETFDDEDRFPKRESSDYDVINMEELFRELYFLVKKYTNKSAQGIISCLQYERSNIPTSDIFVAVIMSHGSRDSVYGTDGKSVPIDDITAIFNGDNCQQLRETPKLFFIDACQGGGTSIAIITHSLYL